MGTWRRATVLAGIVSLVPLGAAQATVFIDNEFESEVVNTATGVPNAGYNVGLAPVATGSFSLNGNMTKPVNAPGITTTGGRKATVFGASQSAVTGFSSQCVGLFSHPAAYGGGDMGYINTGHASGVNDPLTGTTTGQYVFSYDLSIAKTTLNTSTWTVKPTMTLKANYWDSTHHNTGNLPILSITDSLGSIMVTSSDGAAGGAAISTTIFTNAQALTPYHIAALLDMDTRTFTMSVNGQAVGGTFYQMVAAIPGLGLGEYEAKGGQADTTAYQGFGHFLDNISLVSAPVPEPTSLGLLSLGALLLRRRGR